MKSRTKAICAGLASAALLTAAPAAAEESQAARIARQLSDPLTQYMAAGVIAGIAKSMLDTDIEPLVRAVRSAGGGAAVRDLPPGARLGDVVGPEADRVPGEIMAHVPRLLGAAAGMAGAMEEMRPQLQAMARRWKDAVPRD